MARICLALLCAFIAVLTVASAQVQLERSLLFVDKSSAKGHLWQANSSATESQGFLFPSATGSVGQVVKVQSVSDGSATFIWSTPTGSLAGLSSVTTQDEVDGNAWALGPGISIVSTKTYRIVGELGVYRIDAPTGVDRDRIKVSLRDMPSNTYAEYSIECLNCPDATGVPGFASGTGTDLLYGSVIEPDQSNELVGPNNTFYYRIEGVVKPTANGAVYFGFNKDQGGNNTILVTGSYWAVIEIE
jgi:hypothetical protein